MNLSNPSFPVTIDGITIDYYCDESGDGIDIMVGDFGVQIPIEISEQVVAAIIRARIRILKLQQLDNS